MQLLELIKDWVQDSPQDLDYLLFQTYHEPFLDTTYHTTVEFINKEMGYKIKTVVKSFSQDNKIINLNDKITNVKYREALYETR